MPGLVVLDAERIAAEAERRRMQAVSMVMRLYRPLGELEKRLDDIELALSIIERFNPRAGRTLREAWGDWSGMRERIRALSDAALGAERTAIREGHLSLVPPEPPTRDIPFPWEFFDDP